VQKLECRKGTEVHQHALLLLRRAVQTRQKNQELQKNLVVRSARVRLCAVVIDSTLVPVAIVRAQQKKV
jgi:hypothetical protein